MEVLRRELNNVIKWGILISLSVFSISCSISKPNIKEPISVNKKWELKANGSDWVLVSRHTAQSLVALQGDDVKDLEKNSIVDGATGKMIVESESINVARKEGGAVISSAKYGLDFYYHDDKLIAFKSNRNDIVYSILAEDALALMLEEKHNILMLWLDDEKWVAVELSTGNKLWESTLPEDTGFFIKAANSPDDQLLLIFSDVLLEVDAKTGKVLKNIEYELEFTAPPVDTGFGGLKLLTANFKAWGRTIILTGPIYDEKSQILYLTSNGITAIDWKNGKFLWNEEVEMSEGTGFFSTWMRIGYGVDQEYSLGKLKPLFLPDERVVVYNLEGEVTCLDAKTGEEVWESEDADPLTTMALIDQKIHIQGSFGFRTLDPKTGKVVNSFISDEPVLVLKNKNKIYFISKENIHEFTKEYKKIKSFQYADAFKTGEIWQIMQSSDNSSLQVFSENRITSINLDDYSLRFTTGLGASYNIYIPVGAKNDNFVFIASMGVPFPNATNMYAVSEKTGKIHYYKAVNADIGESMGRGLVLKESNRFIVMEQEGVPADIYGHGNTLSAYELFPSSGENVQAIQK